MEPSRELRRKAFPTRTSKLQRAPSLRKWSTCLVGSSQRASPLMSSGQNKKPKSFPSFKSAPKSTADSVKQSNPQSIKAVVKPSSRPNAVSHSAAAPANDVFGSRLSFLHPELADRVPNPSVESHASKSQSKDESIRPTQSDFNKKLKNNPHDIDLWIEFLHFQDLAVHSGSNRRGCFERKIAIAVKAVENNPDSIELVLIHLGLVDDYEDMPTLFKTWDYYLKAWSEKPDELAWKLYSKYLTFRQKHFLAYNFEQVNSAYMQAFGRFKSSVSIAPILALRYIEYLGTTGYYERAIGICQVIIELNIEQFKHGTVDIDAFGDQWDAGLMDHVGERGSSLKSGIDGLKFLPNLTFFEKWLALERWREESEFLPVHDDGSDDYERQICFDDVRSCIVLVERDQSLAFIENNIEALARCLSIRISLHSPCLLGSSISRKSTAWFIYFLMEDLLPFYTLHWRFLCQYFCFLNVLRPEESDELIKDYLSKHKNSFEPFFAFGRFKQLKGDYETSEKIYANLSKHACSFQGELDSFCQAAVPEATEAESFSIVDDKNQAQIYDMLRSNPGNKLVYLKIIEQFGNDEKLCREVVSLMDEQQIRVRTLLEEVEML